MKKTITACALLRDGGEQTLGTISSHLGVSRESARLMLRKLRATGCVEQRKSETTYAFVRMPRKRGRPAA